MFKKTGLAVLAIMLVSCGVPMPRTPATGGDLEPRSIRRPPDSVNYRIEPAGSELRLLVHRAGPMARFGHNHVIVNRGLTGSVSVDGASRSSSFSLSIAASDFLVDDAKTRQEEGADFSDVVPDEAKSGTLRNMLSAALLDAAEYPSISVEASGIAGNSGEVTATLTIRIAGRESKVDVPFMLRSDVQRLSAEGAFDLRQTAVGLTPFSLMLGALQVQDSMHLKFKIVAVRGSAEPAS